jgi:tetratricopeptide (TPR) repeat protein
VGEARWSSPRARLRVLRLERVDNDYVQFDLGPTHRITLHGRRSRLSSPRLAAVPYTYPTGWSALAMAPHAEPGARVILDGEPVPEIDGAEAPVRLEGVPVGITVFEAHVALADLVVEGKPTRTDAPAIAFAPAGGSIDAPTSARVKARFQVEPDPKTELALGGPFVGLGDGASASVWLELLPDRLVLRRERWVLAEAPLTRPSQSGVLVLERRVDAWRGALRRPGQEVPTAELEVIHPLPLRVPAAQAAWGSTAPRVRFAEVTLHGGPLDAARAELDATYAASGDPGQAARLLADPEPQGPLEQLRLGALHTVSASDPTWVAPGLRGAPNAGARRAVAAEAGAWLERAAEGLTAAGDAKLREAAQARAALAWIHAGDGVRAEAAAEALVQAAGLPAARAAFDALFLDRGAPALLTTFLDRTASVLGPEAREAGLRVVRVLAPERSAEVSGGLASLLMHQRPDPGTAAGRATLERALTLYTEADAPNLPTENREAARNGRGEVLLQLGRVEEALPLWERAASESNRYYEWTMLATCQTALGDLRGALVSQLTALARSPGNRALVRGLLRALDALAATGQHSGLVACALLAVERVHPGVVPEARARARALAEGAPEEPTADGHLALYARACLGETTVALTQGKGPGATLARARAGAPGDRRALFRYARESRVVHTLASLDPELAPLLQRRR